MPKSELNNKTIQSDLKLAKDKPLEFAIFPSNRPKDHMVIFDRKKTPEVLSNQAVQQGPGGKVLRKIAKDLGSQSRG